MKFVKTAILPLTLIALASCGANPKPSVPEGQFDAFKVTKEVWEEQLVKNETKPFYFGENYKLVFTAKGGETDIEETYFVDNGKLKFETKENKVGYFAFSGGAYEQYSKTSDGTWQKKTIVKTVMDYLVKDGLVVFNSENIYNDFNFDEASLSYKLDSFLISGAFSYSYFYNNEAKFVDNKAVFYQYGLTNITYSFNFTYGGQSVTLPDIE